MTDREKAISYLAEGHALLRKYGLYGASDDEHFFALDRALENIGRRAALPLGTAGDGAIACAAEAAAALQALYEAKRLVTARSSIEGRRIILGDWFLSLAVGLSLPLRSPGLTALVSEELRRIGTDANRISFRVSKKDFFTLIDRFTSELFMDTAGDTAGTVLFVSPATQKEPSPLCPQKEPSPLFPENKLLASISSGYYKTAAAETRHALSRMEAFFTSQYASESANEMDGWIYSALMSGGKRLRPILVRLCAGLGSGCQSKQKDESDETAASARNIIYIMSTIELIHSASLVHDDIVDRSPMRRSRATINAKKGDGYAAMCGFKMIADALDLTGDDVPEKITEMLAAVPMQMCGGELNQFDIENRPELQSESEYFKRIGCKTAALIAGSCVCGAIAGRADEQTVRVVADYGRALGLLFQLRDDLLDYGSPEMTGKPVSQDMERGIYSLPLLYAKRRLAETDPSEAAKLDTALRKHIKGPTDFRYLNEIAIKTGGIGYTHEAIAIQTDRALSSLALLPQNPYTEALSLLVTALAGIQTQTPESLRVFK